MINVRKIIKKTHWDGTCSYVVKVRIFWFFWYTDSWWGCNAPSRKWAVPADCVVQAVFNSLNDAREYIKDAEEAERKAELKKVIKRETVR